MAETWSLYSTSTLIQTHKKNVILCHKVLEELAKRNTVHIKSKWIAAHVVHWGNERPDELPKIETTSTSLVKGYIPQSHIKAVINQKVNLLDQIELTSNGHCHTNTILGNKHKHTTKNTQRKAYQQQNILQNCHPTNHWTQSLTNICTT